MNKRTPPLRRTLPGTPCREPGCYKEAYVKGVCETHYIPFKGVNRKDALPRNWNSEIRHNVITRAQGKCEHCGAYYAQGLGFTVDHKQPGNNHSYENLQLLCYTCNVKKTAEDGSKARWNNRR